MRAGIILLKGISLSCRRIIYRKGLRGIYRAETEKEIMMELMNRNKKIHNTKYIIPHPDHNTPIITWLVIKLIKPLHKGDNNQTQWFKAGMNTMSKRMIKLWSSHWRLCNRMSELKRSHNNSNKNKKIKDKSKVKRMRRKEINN